MPTSNSAPQENQGPWFKLEIAAVIQETPDARSVVLRVPASLRETFRYKAGQFLTFRFHVNGARLIRCYSLASAPDVDPEHKVTVKRVTAGRVSNFMNERLAAGDVIEVMKPAGLFCLEPRASKLMLFSGGSGITPCISIVKTALATTHRSVKLVYANRDRASIIFRDELERLQAQYPQRFELVHRLDVEHGFADMDAIRDYIGPELGADFYICGPGPFMDTVEGTLHALGVDRHQIFIERFESSDDVTPDAHDPTPTTVSAAGDAPITLVVQLDGKATEIAIRPGKTILQMGRDAGLEPPFACEEGYCGCCVATLLDGTVHMKTNDCLDKDELARKQVLTCQSIPTSRRVEIRYPD